MIDGKATMSVEAGLIVRMVMELEATREAAQMIDPRVES